jgi:geranylgeranyl pyrophosphate synthase
VHGMEESRRRAARAVARAKDALSPFGKKAAALAALADYIIERDR